MLHTRTMQIGVLERTGLTCPPRSVCGVPLPLRNYVYQNENEIRRLFPPSASLSLSLSPCRPLPAASERGCCAFRLSVFPRRGGGSRRDQICSRSLSPSVRALPAPWPRPRPRTASSLEPRKREDVAVGVERARCANQTNQEPAGQPASAGLRATCRSLALMLAKRGSGEQSVEDILEIQCRMIQTPKARTGFTKTTMKWTKRTFAVACCRNVKERNEQNRTDFCRKFAIEREQITG